LTDDLVIFLINPGGEIVADPFLANVKTALLSLYSRCEIDVCYLLQIVQSFSEEKLELVSRRSFSVTAYHPLEMLLIICAFFVRSEISTRIGIAPTAMIEFVNLVRRHYNDVPYHNWFHAMDVTQFVYSVIVVGKVGRFLDDAEVFALLLASLCHDAGHNGLNNSFHRKTNSVLARLGPNLPPLEHYHSCLTVYLASSLLSVLEPATQVRISGLLIDCIMATDMEQHKVFVTKFGALQGCFDRSREGDRRLLAQIILKAADLSNVVRDFDEASRSSCNLSEECHRQGDREVELGFPISPMCDRMDQTPMCQGQIAFYTFVAGPLMTEVHRFFPELYESQAQFENNLGIWQNMKKEWDQSHSPEKL
jgi:hypothetical protein